MLFLSACGMAIGLALDCSATPPELLAAMCTASTASFTASLVFHATMMPASYAMMAAGAVLAAGLTATAPEARAVGRTGPRAAGALTSVMLMLAGMFAGGWLAPEVAAGLGVDFGFAFMTAGMTGGMAAATLADAAIARGLDAVIARRGRRRLQYIMYQ